MANILNLQLYTGPPFPMASPSPNQSVLNFQGYTFPFYFVPSNFRNVVPDTGPPFPMASPSPNQSVVNFQGYTFPFYFAPSNFRNVVPDRFLGPLFIRFSGGS
jgi:hypothetical protein